MVPLTGLPFYFIIGKKKKIGLYFNDIFIYLILI